MSSLRAQRREQPFRCCPQHVQKASAHLICSGRINTVVWLGQKGRVEVGDEAGQGVGSHRVEFGDSLLTPYTFLDPYTCLLCSLEMTWAFWTPFLHFSVFSLLIPIPGDPGDPFRGQQFRFSASSVTDKLCGLQAPFTALSVP